MRWAPVGYVDIASGLYFVLCAYALDIWRERFEPGWALLSGVLAGLAFAIATFGGLSASKAIFVCSALGDVFERILQPTRRVVDAILFTLFFALAIRDALNVTFAEVAVEALIAHVAVVDDALKRVASRRRPVAVFWAVAWVLSVFTIVVATLGGRSSTQTVVVFCALDGVVYHSLQKAGKTGRTVLRAIRVVTFGDEIIALQDVYADSLEVEAPFWKAHTGRIPPIGTAVTIVITE